MTSIAPRTLVSLLLAGLTVQTATAAPKGNTDANAKTENDGWTYVEVGARNTEVSPDLFRYLSPYHYSKERAADGDCSIEFGIDCRTGGSG